MVTASTLVSLSVSPEDRGAEPSDRNDPLSPATSALVTQDTLLSSCMCRKLLSSSWTLQSNPEFSKAPTIPTPNSQKTKRQTLTFNIIKKFPLIFMLAEI